MSKTYVIGDAHGSWRSLFAAAAKCPGANRLLVAGDFGYFPSHVAGITDILALSQLPDLHFIEGNHDDIPTLENTGACDWPATWLPRGSVLEDGHQRHWLCIGGADSVDRCLRQSRGLFWTERETITEEEISQAAAMRDIYGIISHTAPKQFCIPGVDDMPIAKQKLLFSMNGWNFDERLNISRQRLNRLLEALKPQHWLFAHFHLSAQGKQDGCQWQCLLNVDHPKAPAGTWACLEDL